MALSYISLSCFDSTLLELFNGATHLLCQLKLSDQVFNTDNGLVWNWHKSDQQAYQSLNILNWNTRDTTGNTKGVSITVPLTSCLTGLESAVRQLTIFVFICKTDKSKQVKQEVNGILILPPLVFPGY
jgi:hypothetical protein